MAERPDGTRRDQLIARVETQQEQLRTDLDRLVRSSLRSYGVKVEYARMRDFAATRVISLVGSSGNAIPLSEIDD